MDTNIILKEKACEQTKTVLSCNHSNRALFQEKQRTSVCEYSPFPTLTNTLEGLYVRSDRLLYEWGLIFLFIDNTK